MRLVTRPRGAASREHGGGPDAGLGAAAAIPDAPRELRAQPSPEARHAPARSPTLEAKRRAVKLLKRSFGRIEADFSEAYEQCRNDTHRTALERARLAAKTVGLRARRDELLEDRAGWRRAEAAFAAAAAKAKRKLAALKTASAVARIVKRLDAMAVQLAVLTA